MFNSPGAADELSEEVLGLWDEQVRAAYQSLEADLATRFFALDPAEVAVEVQPPVRWFADAAHPGACLGQERTQQLCDWGARGRYALHNEYCEYASTARYDREGRRRLKRVEVTTELREYWLALAIADPELVRSVAAETLGRSVTLEDLYGPGPDPTQDGPEVRVRRFCTQTAGSGFTTPDVPDIPAGLLNFERALFMANPINGLDDLLFVAMFGARPWATDEPEPSPASRDQILRAAGGEFLACNNADPAVFLATAAGAFQGRTVTFADPLGVYISTFASSVFSLDGQDVPAEWIRFSRGKPGMWQRLEFGPADDDPRFLDDAVVAIGAQERPVTGGYQVLQQVEVGPLLAFGAATPVADDEYVRVPVEAEPISCADGGEGFVALAEEFDRHHARTRTLRPSVGRGRS